MNQAEKQILQILSLHAVALSPLCSKISAQVRGLGNIFNGDNLMEKEGD